MPSFEDVTSNLSFKEKILWTHRKRANQLKELRANFLLLIFVASATGFTEFLYFGTSTIIFNVFVLLFLILFIFLVSLFPLYIFLHSFFEYRKFSKKLEVNIRALGNFEEFCVLTNKRWIQKSFFLIKYDYSESESDVITFQKDLAFVNLADIEIIYIFSEKDGKTHHINFFIAWDKWSEESVLQASLEDFEYTTLMNALHKVFSVVKEVRDIISYGDMAFYCKKKK